MVIQENKEQMDTIMNAKKAGYAYVYNLQGNREKELLLSLEPENLANFIGMYGLHADKILITDIYENKNSISLNDSLTLVALVNVMMSYLERSYQENDLGSVLQTIHFIKELPTNPVIMFHKLVTIYYQALINHDQKRLDLITKVLQKNGYDNYLAWLP